MVGEVVSSIDGLRQGKFELNIRRFIAAHERGSKHFSVRLIRGLGIVDGFLWYALLT